MAYRNSMKSKDKPVHDFVLHRAAYMFAIGSCKDEWDSPAMFVEKVKRDAGKSSMHLKMLGMLKDHYLRVGLGWDDDKPLKDVDVYLQDSAYAEYHDLDPQELFRSYFRERAILRKNVKERQAKERRDGSPQTHEESRFLRPLMCNEIDDSMSGDDVQICYDDIHEVPSDW